MKPYMLLGLPFIDTRYVAKHAKQVWHTHVFPQHCKFKLEASWDKSLLISFFLLKTWLNRVDDNKVRSPRIKGSVPRDMQACEFPYNDIALFCKTEHLIKHAFLWLTLSE